MAEDDTKKRPVGRPTKYKPEYCERVIAMAKEGKGWANYAAEFEVDRASLYDWAASHEEFSTALTRAKVLEQQWWEDQARENLKSREFNANLWIKSAQARFREDYTERKQTEITGADGGAIKTESVTRIDPSALDPDQRSVLKQLLLAAKEGTK